MKKSLLIFVLAALLLPLAAYGQDGEFELTFGWKIWTETGTIHDIHFMPGGDEIIISTDGNEIEIRDVITGEIVHDFQADSPMNGPFGFNPDSTIIVMATDAVLQTIDIENFTRIKIFGLEQDTIPRRFSNIAIDPKRPYVFVTEWGQGGAFPNVITRGRVSVYNYETMELVRHLTDFGPYAYECLAISPDGKYLATINDGRSYLKVWDLSNFELVVDYRLYDPTYQGDGCEASDIEFSQKNHSELFYSGNFPASTDGYYGIAKFNINKNEIVDRRFPFVAEGEIILFDDEERVLYLTSLYNKIINFTDALTEYKYRKYAEKPGRWHDGIYSEKHDLFIGWASAYAQAGTYNRGVSVIGDEDHNSIIYPNPTNNIAYISVDCFDPEMRYEIYDSAGHIIYKTDFFLAETEQIEIDLSPYPNGTYFVKLYCGDTVKSYQIVKEG